MRKPSSAPVHAPFGAAGRHDGRRGDDLEVVSQARLIDLEVGLAMLEADAGSQDVAFLDDLGQRHGAEAVDDDGRVHAHAKRDGAFAARADHRSGFKHVVELDRLEGGLALAAPFRLAAHLHDDGLQDVDFTRGHHSRF
jgi:hypothetical protein